MRKIILILLAFASLVCGAEDVRLMLPEVIYAVPGVEMNVYFRNIVTVINPANYVFDVDCRKGDNGLKRWSFTPAAKDVGTYPWKIRVIGQNGVAAQAETRLVVLPADAGKDTIFTVLMVGASQTGAGIYPDRVAELMKRPGNPAFTMLGTRSRTLAKHEGYGGWGWKTFFERWGFTNPNTKDGMHPNRAVEYNSPFLFPDPADPAKGVFDLPRYFREKANGKIPDAVTFQLGLNDFFLSTDETIQRNTEASLAHMEKMIREFQKLKPQPVLLVFLHIPGSDQDGFGRNYHCGQTAWQYRKNLDFYNRALVKKCKALNIIPVPVYINIDTENNMVMRKQNVNSDNPQKILRAVNGLHPAPAGYAQMGDTLYCWLKAVLREKSGNRK